MEVEALRMETGSKSPEIPKGNEATEPMETAGELQTEDSRAVAATMDLQTATVTPAGDDGVVAGGLITPAMVEEEKKLHQKTVDEEEAMRHQHDAKSYEQEEKEQRYNRLKFLLSKSNLYTNYLVQRMERQSTDEVRQQQRREKRLQRELAKRKPKETQEGAKDEEKENVDKKENTTRKGSVGKPEEKPSDVNVLGSPAASRRASSRLQAASPPPNSRTPRTTRASRNSPALRSPQSSSQESLGSPAPQRRGRKRKAETPDNYRIADYFDKALAASKKQKCDKSSDDEKQHADATEEKTVTDADKPVDGDIAVEKSNAVTVNSSESVMTSECEEQSKAAEPKPAATEKAEPEPTTDLEKKGDDEDDDDDIELAPRYFDGELVPSDQPQLFSGGILRPYQVEGFNWLKVIYENGINGILADEMGLGKTIQCIAAVSYLVEQGVPGPYLVCAPLSTVPNWVAEFQRFTPLVPCILYHGTRDERQALRRQITRLQKVTENIKTYPVVVTSYEITMNDRKFMQNFAWKYIIVDEGHRIKNFQCRLIKELKMYHSTHRLLLTGTPLQNNLSELWSLLNFLLPEIFDDLTSFETWFDMDSLQTDDGHSKIVAEEERKNILGMLHQILIPFMLRRLKVDVALAIPPKREVLVYAPLTKKQEDFYRAAVDKTIGNLVPARKQEEVQLDPVPVEDSPGGRKQRKAASKKVNYALMMESEDEKQRRIDGVKESSQEIDDWAQAVSDLQDEAEDQKKTEPVPQQKQKSVINIKIQNILMLLRKSCNHPYLLEYPLTDDGQFKVDENIVKASGKFLLLDRMLPELKKRGHKVLIFSQMTSILDVLGDYCYMRKYSYSRLDGSMNLTERRAEIDNFNKDPDLFLFLLSTRAGGLGINLTAADTVIIFDSDWNPQADLQAQDRCHRIGQTRPVMVYRLVTANTIDQKIVERAAAKRKLEKMVILKGKFREGICRYKGDMKTIDPKDLLELLKSRDYDSVVEGRQGQVISNRELDYLLDRSELQAAYDKQIGQTDKSKPGKKKRTKPDRVHNIEGVFKVLDDDIDGLQSSSPEQSQDTQENSGSQSEETSQKKTSS